MSPTPSPTEESCASGHTLSESPLQEVERLSLASPPGESDDTVERPSQESLTDVELRKFAFSLENGYDVKDNHRYNMWLEIYHTELCDSPSPRSSKEVTGPSEVLGLTKRVLSIRFVNHQLQYLPLVWSHPAVKVIR